jgi:quercetin dioxygenase-like cupin family protein
MHIANTNTNDWETRTGNAMFIGEVHAHGLVDDKMSEQTRLLLVRFSPGGRTRWHTHSFEQALVIVDGRGIVATETQERVVQPGDVVVFGTNEKHWHGATNSTGMSHIAVNLAGSNQILEDSEIKTPNL